MAGLAGLLTGLSALLLSALALALTLAALAHSALLLSTLAALWAVAALVLPTLATLLTLTALSTLAAALVLLATRLLTRLLTRPVHILIRHRNFLGLDVSSPPFVGNLSRSISFQCAKRYRSRMEQWGAVPNRAVESSNVNSFKFVA